MIARGNALLAYQIKFWKEQIKPTLTEALKKAPANKLNWAPAPGMIPLGLIFLHIAECSDWWYDEVMKKNTAVELALGKAPSKAVIAKHLRNHWIRLDRFFAEPPKALGTVYSIKRQTKTHKYSGAWIFTHLLEHDLHHRSQINQYLRILGITPPEI